MVWFGACARSKTWWCVGCTRWCTPVPVFVSKSARIVQWVVCRCYKSWGYDWGCLTCSLSCSTALKSCSVGLPLPAGLRMYVSLYACMYVCMLSPCCASSVVHPTSGRKAVDGSLCMWWHACALCLLRRVCCGVRVRFHLFLQDRADALGGSMHSLCTH